MIVMDMALIIIIIPHRKIVRPRRSLKMQNKLFKINEELLKTSKLKWLPKREGFSSWKIKLDSWQFHRKIPFHFTKIDSVKYCTTIIQNT